MRGKKKKVITKRGRKKKAKDGYLQTGKNKKRRYKMKYEGRI
jgi:hypothetical protein